MSGILAALAGIKTAIATAVDEYFNRVTLLLNTSSTNGAQNNTFLDSSTNNFTITRNGNTTQGTFTPFSQTGWGNYFNGSSYLTVPASSAFAPGTGDFTVDGWIYPTSGAAIQRFFAQSTSGTNYFLCEADVPNNTIRFIGTSSGGGTPIISAATLQLNTWNHFCVSRTSGTVTVWCNGSAGTPTSNTTDFNNTSYTPTISGYSHSTGSEPIIGYLSGLRYIKGTALSGATVPTTPSTAITGTSLLTCQANRFVDVSSSPNTITVGGTPSVQAFSPFLPTAAYDTAVVGGSGYFDGSGDYLTGPSASGGDFSTGDFTISAWFYPTTLTGGTDYGIMSYADTGGWNGWQLQASGTNKNIKFEFLTGSAGASTITGGSIALNAWNYVAIVRSGSTVSMYVNSTTAATSTTNSTAYGAASSRVIVGADRSALSAFVGYISNSKLVKQANAPASIPTAPDTNTTNTSFLLNYTNAGIYDSASKNVLETVGNAQVSTTQAKWGTTSMYFDGTGDYLNAGKNEMFSIGSAEDFTFEAWIYAASVSDVSVFGIGSSTFFAYRILSGSPYIYVQTTGGLLNSGTISANTWTHIAITRSSGTLRSFINGTQAASVANTGSFSASAGTGAGVYVGAANLAGASTPGYVFNGYIDDMRFTKGYARYTSNFTAPTSALPLQ